MASQDALSLSLSLAPTVSLYFSLPIPWLSFSSMVGFPSPVGFGYLHLCTNAYQ